MIYKALLIGLPSKELVRNIDVPDSFVNSSTEPQLLEKIFELGQNDFQPQKVRSLSVGDVVVINENLYKCEDVGWTLL